jgi:hypothetical protein
MKTVCWIVSRFVDGTQPVDNVGFNVGFIVSTGMLSSEIAMNVDITQTDAQMQLAVKAAVAAQVQTMTGVATNAADIRIL